MTEPTATIIPIAAATPEKLFRFSMDENAEKPPVALFVGHQAMLNRMWICWRAAQEPKPVAFVIDDLTHGVTVQMEYANEGAMNAHT